MSTFRYDLVAQTLVWGRRDELAPISLDERYVEAARRSNEKLSLISFADLGHLEKCDARRIFVAGIGEGDCQDVVGERLDPRSILMSRPRYKASAYLKKPSRGFRLEGDEESARQLDQLFPQNGGCHRVQPKH